MKRLLPLALLILAFPACKSYYEVRDLRTDRVYYTRSLERWKAGAIRFKDAASGATVTLTTHEFKKIPKADYENKTSGMSRSVGESRGW